MALEPVLCDQAGRRFTVEDTFAIGATETSLLTTASDSTAMAVIG